MSKFVVVFNPYISIIFKTKLLFEENKKQELEVMATGIFAYRRIN